MPHPPTPFDRVTKVKAAEEERARLALVHAIRSAEERRLERDAAWDQAHQDARIAGDCAEWMLADLSHTRVRSGLSHAEEKLCAASAEVGQRRQSHADAYRNLRQFEGLVEKRRAAHLVEQRRAEQAEFDEIASILFWRDGCTL